jgi:hypothetical protein
MFYEMLTGQLPDEGKTITEIVPILPKGCDAFFEKATAKSPDARFSTAGEFREAILGLYEASRSPSKPVTVSKTTEPSLTNAAAVQSHPKNGVWRRMKAFLSRLLSPRARGNR